MNVCAELRFLHKLVDEQTLYTVVSDTKLVLHSCFIFSIFVMDLNKVQLVMNYDKNVILIKTTVVIMRTEMKMY